MTKRYEYKTKDGTNLIIRLDTETKRFWWFNFHQKVKRFADSDGNGNAQEYREEVEKYLEQKELVNV